MKSPRPRLSERLIALRADKIPPGWMRIEDLARDQGLAPTTARGSFYNVVQASVAAGLLARRRFRLATATGLRPVTHYRYK